MLTTAKVLKIFNSITFHIKKCVTQTTPGCHRRFQGGHPHRAAHAEPAKKNKTAFSRGPFHNDMDITIKIYFFRFIHVILNLDAKLRS